MCVRDAVGVTSTPYRYFRSITHNAPPSVAPTDDGSNRPGPVVFFRVYLPGFSNARALSS